MSSITLAPSWAKVPHTISYVGLRALDTKVDPHWLWKGRRVQLFDVTTVNKPDTPENQAAYRQSGFLRDSRTPGLRDVHFGLNRKAYPRRFS